MQKKNYRKTAVACYLGFVTQSIAANFAPLLYLTFQKSYGIPLTQIALISTTFFFYTARDRSHMRQGGG